MILKITRLIILFIYFGLVFTLGIIISLLRPKHPNNTYHIAVLLRASFFILGIKTKIKGTENLNGDTPSIFVANHQHNIDFLIAALIMKPNTVTIGKTDLAKIPVFGQFYTLSGNILVDRSSPKKAIRALRLLGTTIREKSISVWVFPEGTRNVGDVLLPFKRGAFVSAIEAQAPIIPVAVKNYSHINISKWSPGTIEINILPIVLTEGLESRDSGELAGKLQGQMQALI
ncbi:MAG: 1-acyl-sn-glycerol-3-phosphate acyltransferase [Bacteriovoracaceae bacterium]|nr:1-acyl-sn-glycerol-3-phosphate acyltransferase [Bacteriovoracaceae bacterium]